MIIYRKAKSCFKEGVDEGDDSCEEEVKKRKKSCLLKGVRAECDVSPCYRNEVDEDIDKKRNKDNDE